jgi:hypothetical protein
VPGRGKQASAAVNIVRTHDFTAAKRAVRRQRLVFGFIGK